MKGTLTDQPLAELIREISIKGLSGTLRLEQENVRTAIYFESGSLIFAASNLRTLRLRAYLTKRDLVPEKQFESIGDKGSDLSMAATLVADRMLTQEQVDFLLETLVADVLRVALLWMEGGWEFDERAHLDDPVRVNVDTSSLLREAAHRMPLKFVSLRFQNPNETFSRTAEVSGNHIFLPAESFILSRLDAPTKLEELVMISGLDELEARRIIYGLTLSGLVKREYWKNAFRTDTGKQSQEKPEITGAGQRPAGEGDRADSRWGPASDEAGLEIFLERVGRASNYYEIIDLPQTAQADEFKDAYYALARRYHPDRFHLKSGTPLHSKISSAFAKVTQAYETLTDPKSRSTYDAAQERVRQFSKAAPVKVDAIPDAEEVELEKDVPETEPDRAEYSFREGFGALKQGRINAAITHLAAAARIEPNDARYRAYYGRALASNERTRRLAESEIQTAVKLEPSNATYRTMLAELYFELKFQKRAQAELERALSLDPTNAAAQLLLRKVETSRKSG
jgi:curved DNA-binding protein CbpA